jgi:hypothetical protein
MRAMTSDLELVEPERHRRGADVEGEPVERAWAFGERLAVEEHEAPVARHRRVEPQAALVEPLGRGLDPQRTSPQRVAAHVAGRGQPGAAGETEAALEVSLLRRGRSQKLGARLDLHQALPALPLLDARSGHVHAERLGAVEQRLAWRELPRHAVDLERPAREQRWRDGRAHVAFASAGAKSSWCMSA